MIRTIRVASLPQNHHTARIFSGGSTGRLLRFQKKMVGAPGFEPGTSRTPSVRATRLRYAPTGTLITVRRKKRGPNRDSCSSNKAITAVRAASRKRAERRAGPATFYGSGAAPLLPFREL